MAYKPKDIPATSLGRGVRGRARGFRRPLVLSGVLGASLTVALISLVFAGESFAAQNQGNGKGGNAKNVILLVGDGMDEQQITAARNYEPGAAGRFNLDTLRNTGDKTTYSIREDDPSKPDYTPESASTATAWSTGSKTADGRISTAPGTDEDLDPTTIEYAESQGLLTGNVSTAELTDATPAAPMAHVTNRSCQGPRNMQQCPDDDKAAGGPGSIAEQSITKDIEVLFGGGAQRYDQPTSSGDTVAEQAEEEGYDVIRTEQELDGVQPGQKVLGLFSSGNMPQEWTGDLATQPTTPAPDTGQRCDESNRDQEANPGAPNLGEMTGKAIELLDTKRGKGGNPGFFLQVEGASIDKRAHASDPCGQIGELVAFDEAVKVALDFARKNKNTQVIVTGDHSHTPQIVEADADPPGFGSRLETNEGEVETISYGTGRTPNTQTHTGAQIRIAAEGPGANGYSGLIDDTDQYDIMTQALKASKGQGNKDGKSKKE